MVKYIGKITSEKYSGILALELNIGATFIRNTIKLLDEGATIPFIARYRKEMTGSMDEVLLMKVRDRLVQLKDLDAGREAIIKSLTEQEKLTAELESVIHEAKTMAELEDLYLPYRPKRKTRASIAIEKGLEPLAKIIFSQKYDDIEAKTRDISIPRKAFILNRRPFRVPAISSRNGSMKIHTPGNASGGSSNGKV